MTGGAIKQALQCCKSGPVFIVNGDTFFDVPLDQMLAFHKSARAVLTIATKEMTDFDRYGTVEVNEEGRVISFQEKRFCHRGAINGGIYLLNRDALAFDRDIFSFEHDYMEKYVEKERFFAFPSSGYFIDIGVPQDYEKAQNDFRKGERL